MNPRQLKNMLLLTSSIFSVLSLIVEATQTNVVGLGKECGGGTLEASICAEGLSCRHDGLLGSKGYCVPTAKLGESCNGGGIQFPAMCESGLSCVFPPLKTANIAFVGRHGVCLKEVPIGEGCGGGTLNAPICQTNAVCIGRG
jgi:hypothetical protein